MLYVSNTHLFKYVSIYVTILCYIYYIKLQKHIYVCIYVIITTIIITIIRILGLPQHT